MLGVFVLLIAAIVAFLSSGLSFEEPLKANAAVKGYMLCEPGNKDPKVFQNRGCSFVYALSVQAEEEASKAAEIAKLAEKYKSDEKIAEAGAHTIYAAALANKAYLNTDGKLNPDEKFRAARTLAFSTRLAVETQSLVKQEADKEILKSYAEKADAQAKSDRALVNQAAGSSGKIQVYPLLVKALKSEGIAAAAKIQAGEKNANGNQKSKIPLAQTNPNNRLGKTTNPTFNVLGLIKKAFAQADETKKSTSNTKDGVAVQVTEYQGTDGRTNMTVSVFGPGPSGGAAQELQGTSTVTIDGTAPDVTGKSPQEAISAVNQTSITGTAPGANSLDTLPAVPSDIPITTPVEPVTPAIPGEGIAIPPDSELPPGTTGVEPVAEVVTEVAPSSRTAGDWSGKTEFVSADLSVRTTIDGRTITVTNENGEVISSYELEPGSNIEIAVGSHISFEEKGTGQRKSVDLKTGTVRDGQGQVQGNHQTTSLPPVNTVVSAYLHNGVSIDQTRSDLGHAGYSQEAIGQAIADVIAEAEAGRTDGGDGVTGAGTYGLPGEVGQKGSNDNNGDNNDDPNDDSGNPNQGEGGREGGGGGSSGQASDSGPQQGGEGSRDGGDGGSTGSDNPGTAN